MLCSGLISALLSIFSLYVCAVHMHPKWITMFWAMLWGHSCLKYQHQVTGSHCVCSEATLLFAVPVIEQKCCKKYCICSLRQPQKNKSSIKLLWEISQSIILQDILVSSMLSQPRLLCQMEVRIRTEISKYFLPVPDANISHLLISVIILIPNDNNFLNSPASMQQYDKNIKKFYPPSQTWFTVLLFFFLLFLAVVQRGLWAWSCI